MQNLFWSWDFIAMQVQCLQIFSSTVCIFKLRKRTTLGEHLDSNILLQFENLQQTYQYLRMVLVFSQLMCTQINYVDKTRDPTDIGQTN